MGIKIIWDAIIAGLFPRVCVGCGLEGGLFCKACEEKFKPAPAIVSAAGFHWFDYKEPIIAKLIQAWKFKYDRSAEGVLRRLMMARLKAFTDWSNDWSNGKPLVMIVPVPLTNQRSLERGFNQAEVLASWLGEWVDVPVVGLVKKIGSSGHQTDRTAVERKGSYLDSPFVVDSQLDLKLLLIASKTILLVDDVMTTGATLEAVKVAIKKVFPWINIQVVTLALEK